MGVYDKYGNSLVDSSGGTGEVIPSSYPQEVGYRKSQQLTNIKWTPKGQVPQQGGDRYFPANVQKTGMLYSDTYGINKVVGYDVSIKTFMTAVNNPYSLLYTENANPSHSQSAYGITYVFGDGNTGAYFGSACNHFVMQCIGSPISYSSYDILRGWHGDHFERVYDQSAQGLELMDVMARGGHCMLVTRLWKNNRGVITKVQTSEQTGFGALNNVVKTADEYNEFIARQGYTIFRYKDLYKNINYEPSPFVAIENEVLEPYVYNNDICTFAGDYACFAEGDLLHINYTKGSYTQMEIYKNDSLLETITLDASADVHDVNLTAKGYTYGKYKARLKNGSTYSDYTYWELLNAQISLGSSALTFSSANATPLYWMWTDSKGYTDPKTEITSEQISAGSISRTTPPISASYIKMVFVGEYGRIARIEPIN